MGLNRLLGKRRSVKTAQRVLAKRHRLRMECLEDRRVLAVLFVQNTNDSGPGSLRQAIESSNTMAGADSIAFVIPPTDPGFVDIDSANGGDADKDVFVITPLTALPALNDATGGTDLDASSQTTFGGDTNPNGPEIVLNGQGTNGQAGITIVSDSNRVSGFDIHSFSGSGISITGGNSNWITNNYLGTLPDGQSTEVQPAPIQANLTATLLPESAMTFDAGTDFDGFVSDTNDGTGPLSGTSVHFQASAVDAETINGVPLAYRLKLEFDADVTLSSVTVAGAAFNGPGSVLRVLDANMNVLNSTDTGGGNSFSTHTVTIAPTTADTFFVEEFEASSEWRYRQSITLNGSYEVGNGNGIIINQGSSANIIGTNGDGNSDGEEGNLISANRLNGVLISDAGSSQNFVAGNIIGLNPAANRALANRQNGISINNGAQSNRIGTNSDATSDTEEANVISANYGFGVSIVDQGSENNVVAGNFIGTNGTGETDNRTAAGDTSATLTLDAASATWDAGTDFDGFVSQASDPADLPNGQSIQFRGIGDGGSSEMVDGQSLIYRYRVEFPETTPIESVSISGAAFGGFLRLLDENRNEISRVNIPGGNSFATHRLSVDAEGTVFFIDEYDNNSTWRFRDRIVINSPALLGNGTGVYVSAAGNTIGGPDPADRNVISGSVRNRGLLGRGVWIDGPQADGNSVQNNHIGTDLAGTTSLGNAGDGVSVEHAPNNLIGGSGKGNLISGNGFTGIWMTGIEATDNTIAGNRIGTDVTGTLPLGNGHHGVRTDAVLRATIGTNGDGLDDAGEGNLISSNLEHGIRTFSAIRIRNLAAVDLLISGDIPSVTQSSQIPQADVFGEGGSAAGNWSFNHPVPADILQDYAIVSTGTIAVESASIFTFALGGDDGGRLRIDVNDDGVFDSNDDVIFDDTLHAFRDEFGEISLDAGEYDFEWVGFERGGDDGFELAVAVGAEPATPVSTENGWKVLGDPAPHDEIELVGLITATSYVADQAAAGSVIAGNLIGTDVNGNRALGNRRNGIHLDGTGVRIGTNGDGQSDAGERNVVSGNQQFGIRMFGGGTTHNVIAGNLIGTNADGTNRLSNQFDGISIDDGAHGNLIGTDGDGEHDEVERNTISGNNGHGVSISGLGTDDNVLAGNFIGLNSTGTSANQFAAGIQGASFSVAAETSATHPAGTRFDILAPSLTDDPLGPTRGESVLFRGLNDGGSAEMNGEASLVYRYIVEFAEPITLTSVTVRGAGFNGPDSRLRVLDLQGNELGSNETRGGFALTTNFVQVSPIELTSFVVEEYDTSSIRYRESIQINAPLPLQNYGDGVSMYSEAKRNLVGTNADGNGDAAERNVISGNLGTGVRILDQGTDDNVIAGNYVGTDVNGATAIGNHDGGVLLHNRAQRNLIGIDFIDGQQVGAGNVISANQGTAVGVFDFGTELNVVAGNIVGLDASGQLPLGNRSGIEIHGSAQSRIGTNGDGNLDEDERNVVSANQNWGIFLGPGSEETTVAGNYVGTDSTGTTSRLNESGIDATVTLQPESSGTFEVGTNFDGFVSETDDPLGPASGVGVHFVGTGDPASSTETLNEAFLIYRYRVQFDEPTTLSSVAVTGAAFNGPDNVLRVLDENMNVLTVSSTRGGNAFGTQFFNIDDEVGTVFFIDEFDTSGSWRYRQNITFNAPEPLGNYVGGIYVNASRNTIGGDTKLEGNVVSGNRAVFGGGDGILVEGSGATENLIQNNLVGTNASGNAGIANAGNGLVLRNTTGNTIGGPNRGNVFSNNNYGVFVESGSPGNWFAGNKIGTDVDGISEIGNRINGVTLHAPVTFGTDGDGNEDADEGNLVSGNRRDGIEVRTFFETASVFDVDRSISGDLPSAIFSASIPQTDLYGIGGAETGNWAFDHPIPGGTTDNFGVHAEGTLQVNESGTFSFALTGRNGGRLRIDDNGDQIFDGNDDKIYDDGHGDFDDRIYDVTLNAGTYDFTWTTFTFDGTSGFELSVAPGASVANPVSSGNGWKVLGDPQPHPEIELSGPINVTTYHRDPRSVPTTILAGNLIGTDSAGATAIPNQGAGVAIFSANTRVGSDGNGVSDSDERNVISGNQVYGIVIEGSQSTNNRVLGNHVGVGLDGSTEIGNGAEGVYIFAASFNQIGGVEAGEPNIVKHNGSAGVMVAGDASRSNSIRGNSISQNLGLSIDLGAVGASTNDLGDADTGSNDLQNYPILSILPGPTPSLFGILQSMPNTTYSIDAYSASQLGPGFSYADSHVSAIDVTTDSQGSAAFNIPVDPLTLVSGHIAATATDPQGNTSELSLATIVPPKVLAVKVGSPDWTGAFKQFVDPGAEVGYQIPHGDAQLAPLPWDNLRQIFIEFTKDVGDVTSADVQIISQSGFDYQAEIDVNYSAEHRRATLDFDSNFNIDSFFLVVKDNLTDQQGNALDGDWITSSGEVFSGNNVAGGNFLFEFNVVPGDVSQSTFVAVNDIGKIRAGLGSMSNDENYSIMADTNGSGGISVDDMTPLRNNLGLGLPLPLPATGSQLVAQAIDRVMDIDEHDDTDENQHATNDDDLDFVWDDFNRRTKANQRAFIA